MLISKVDGDMQMVIKSKIVEILTGLKFGNIKEILTEALFNGIINADNNANNPNTLSVGKVNGGIQMVNKSRTLFGRMEDANNVATSWSLVGKFDIKVLNFRVFLLKSELISQLI